MVLRLIVRTVVWISFTGVILFVCAGTIRWLAAWIYLIEVGTTGIGIGIWLARHDPALLRERMSSLVQREQKAWDKILIIGVFVVFHAWLAFMAIDAVRYRWSLVPAWLQVIGALSILVSMYVSFLTFRENSFAAPVVKIQKERGQKVITTGPYGYVRHPMYAGALFYFIGVPLLLGSSYGLAGVPIFTVVLALRAVMEERTLRAELEGYDAYAARVRYRFVPGIW
jgi:protein-S-isoprenylcysteine O-methyltransferase Ste14